MTTQLDRAEIWRERPACDCSAPVPGEVDGVVEQLKRSPSFLRYREAFETAVGMPLWIEAPMHGASGPPEGGGECPGARINSFCREIFWSDHPCQACLEAHKKLLPEPGESSATLECFAGLKVTAVPVRQGGQVLAYLRTGQVFTREPGKYDFEEVRKTLEEDETLGERDFDYLSELYFDGQVTSEGHYKGMVQLLVFFAEQLSASVTRRPVEGGVEWPEPVKKVADFLRRHFEEEHSLDDLARVAGLSANHLCAVFKEAAGTTMTEFLNRERIHQAKKRLMSRYARVSEVCLDVGFGSVSQFNRCFQKYTGESPSAFRQRVIRA